MTKARLEADDRGLLSVLTAHTQTGAGSTGHATEKLITYPFLDADPPRQPEMMDRIVYLRKCNFFFSLRTFSFFLEPHLLPSIFAFELELCKVPPMIVARSITADDERLQTAGDESTTLRLTRHASNITAIVFWPYAASSGHAPSFTCRRPRVHPCPPVAAVVE